MKSVVAFYVFLNSIHNGVHLNKTVVYATWVLIMYFIFMLINGGGMQHFC